MSPTTPSHHQLNESFGLPGALHFADAAPGLAVAEISTALANARVALQGAQVLGWQPVGQHPVIWVSKAAVFEPGKAVRGGVPVCWPWFGAHEGLPAHGFVRTRMWQVRATSLAPTGEVTLRLGIVDDAASRAMWAYGFDLELVVIVSTTLTMALTTLNTGDMPLHVTQALHSYFCVGQIDQTSVQGLETCHYLDKVQNFAPQQQSGVIRFTGETDRIYVNTAADCLIDDVANQRVIRVAKKGSASTVVWNPWSEREKALADMAAGEYQQMLCVETCNAGPDQIVVLPGESHTLVAELSII